MTTAPPRQKRSRKKYAQVSAPAEAVALTPPTPLPDTSGRVAIEALEPEIDGGLFAVKRVVGDEVSLSVDIFSDGHDEIAADILYRPAREPTWRRAPLTKGENDRWSGRFVVETNEHWIYTVEAWRDPFATARLDLQKKLAAGQDVSVETREIEAMIEEAQAQLRVEPTRGCDEIDDPELISFMRGHGPRRDVSRYPRELKLVVDRTAARFSAWYELFPRSYGADGRHGTFDDVIARLPYVRDLGFDVLYFPPIHPIGMKNRKGRNNSLRAGPADPGSVYAIGSDAGGHDSVHPELGTQDDFRRLVAAARAHGLEIALDFAVQCSPDHPWIKTHPEWFEWRPDGTIRYAENPPKKYEDIVNLRFDGDAFPGVWYALAAAVRHWVEAGVRIFRVDNPHTKPLPFWRWLIGQINRDNPDVLFLAEAFTRPKMMKRLAKEGFQQSYTYFTWRNTKYELTSYALELAGEMGEYYRPNFFVNTPDINPFYLQTSGRPGFIVRATLAATLSSVWGIYSGFELCEAHPLPGREEYADSEKYEIKHRDFNRTGHIRDHVRALNDIRRDNPALHAFRNILFLNAWNDNVIAYARYTADRSNCVVVLVNLDPHHVQDVYFEIPLWEFGLPDQASVEARDLLLGIDFPLHGKTHFLRLDPSDRPVVIWSLRGPLTAGGHP